MKKITVIGAGNAGCLTALHFGYYCRNDKNVSIELIYDPSRPPEKVGQGTLLDVPDLLWHSMGLTWYKNPIDITPKLGILYEGWGKQNKTVFHPFALDRAAIHISPKKFQDTILKSGYFEVKELDVFDYDKIDSEYIIDCRGKPDNYDNYTELADSINAVVLAQVPDRDLRQNWTRSVATPDGWCFVIPNSADTTSYGYLYNHKITSDKNARENFEEMFGVESQDNFKFKQYVVKDPIIDDRIFLNGNKLFFLEPLEATAMTAYMFWAKEIFSLIIECDKSTRQSLLDLHRYLNDVQQFISWHYLYGSKYDTPFWKQAQQTALLKFENSDNRFKWCYKMAQDENLIECIARSNINYGHWPLYSFKNWYDGMTKLV